jgi:hypothetical protein
MYNLS